MRKGLTVLCCIALFAACTAPRPEYRVCAYVWPSCHNDSLAHSWLWPDGEGEWEVIKKGNPRFEGHYQPKRPLWGYEMDGGTLEFEMGPKPTAWATAGPLPPSMSD